MTPVVAARPDGRRDALAAALAELGWMPDAVDSDGALAASLRERADAVVVTVDPWPDARAFVTVARRHDVPTLVTTETLAGLERDRLDAAAVAAGARGVVRFPAERGRLQAALLAVEAGLQVLEPRDPEEAALARGPGVRGLALSPREREILARAAAGLSTKTIARALGLSPHTVKFHLSTVFEKLGATNRAEAVAAAVRRGELAV
jgi:DNA-binding CsgD family transcriptional regulator